MNINCISHFGKPLHTQICIPNVYVYMCICIYVYMYTCMDIHKYNIYRKIYTKFCQNVVYILCRFCKHFMYVNSDL